MFPCMFTFAPSFWMIGASPPPGAVVHYALSDHRRTCRMLQTLRGPASLKITSAQLIQISSSHRNTDTVFIGASESCRAVELSGVNLTEREREREGERRTGCWWLILTERMLSIRLADAFTHSLTNMPMRSIRRFLLLVGWLEKVGVTKSLKFNRFVHRFDSSCSNKMCVSKICPTDSSSFVICAFFFSCAQVMWAAAVTLHGNAESSMQNSTAMFGMVSHCPTPAFTDFTGLTLSVYGNKADICARRAGNGGFGSQICRNPHDTPTHMNCVSPKRLSAPEEKAHLSSKALRSCFSLPPVQGRPHRSKIWFSLSFTDASQVIEGWKVIQHIWYSGWGTTRNYG